MRTKIIATLGPSCDSYENIKSLIAAGMDIARMNFSHCKYEEFIERKQFIEKASKELGKKVYIMQDLQGPRIRVGQMPVDGRVLTNGEEVIFSTETQNDPNLIFIDYPELHIDIKPNETIFLANGDMQLRVTKVEEEKIYAVVEREGTLYSRKGVNLPHTKLQNSGLTEKDIKDLEFGLKEGIDYVAISFVQTADDVLKLRDIVGNEIKIISKIETALSLKNIDGIIQASDIIMIARGDLGIEVPDEKLPFIQKNLIRHAIWHGKESIVATQMLLSMLNHPRPTRAEISDVANAVLDGTDIVMLSDETAAGKYPVQAVETLARVLQQTEDFYFERKNLW